MNKTLLFFIFIVIVIIGILGALYFLYEKPKQKDIIVEQVPLNIFTFDKYNESQLSTNFLIFKNGFEIIYNETTVEGGGLTVNVTVNNTYTIKTYNKENQNYYTAYKDISLFGSNFLPQRIDLYLEQPGDISATITQDSILVADYLILSTPNRDIKNISICTKWSVNLISLVPWVNNSNISLKQIDKFDKYKNYDKCYYLGTLTKENSPFNITLYPSAYIDASSKNTINVVIIDKDCYKNDCKIENNGIDLGMKDIELQADLPTSLD